MIYNNPLSKKDTFLKKQIKNGKEEVNIFNPHHFLHRPFPKKKNISRESLIRKDETKDKMRY